MAFYRLTVKVGHMGKGEFGLMTLYVFAKGYSEAIGKVRILHMVKHTSPSVTNKFETIEEGGFVSGVVRNPYFNVSKYEDRPITELSVISKILPKVEEYQFETEKGKQLVDFCNKYKNCNGEQKAYIERDFFEWAQNLLEETVGDTAAI